MRLTRHKNCTFQYLSNARNVEKEDFIDALHLEARLNKKTEPMIYREEGMSERGTGWMIKY